LAGTEAGQRTSGRKDRSKHDRSRDSTHSFLLDVMTLLRAP